jgi:Trp operon repressor
MSTEKQLHEFIKQALSYKDEKSLRAFFEAILTPKEIEEIPTRLQIVKMLKQKVPQREIADKLRVGVATVTRGSKEILKGNFSDVA